MISTDSNGAITLNATGTETIGAAITANGTGVINLGASGTTSDILFNANVSSATGAINAIAGRNITLGSGNLSTSGNVSLTGTAGTVSETGAE